MKYQQKHILSLIDALRQNNNQQLYKLVNDYHQSDDIQVSLSMIISQRQATTSIINFILQMVDKNKSNLHTNKTILQKMSIIKLKLQQWQSTFKQLQLINQQYQILLQQTQLIKIQNKARILTQQYIVKDYLDNFKLLLERYKLKYQQCLGLIKQRDSYKLKLRGSQVQEFNKSVFLVDQAVDLEGQSGYRVQSQQMAKTNEGISQQIGKIGQFLSKYELQRKDSTIQKQKQKKEQQQYSKQQLLKQSKKIQQLQQQISFYKNNSYISSDKQYQEFNLNQSLNLNNKSLSENISQSLYYKKSFKQRQISSLKLNNKSLIYKLQKNVSQLQQKIVCLEEEISLCQKKLNDQINKNKDLLVDNLRLKKNVKDFQIKFDLMEYDTIVMGRQSEDKIMMGNSEGQSVKNLKQNLQKTSAQMMGYNANERINNLNLGVSANFGTSLYNDKFQLQSSGNINKEDNYYSSKDQLQIQYKQLYQKYLRIFDDLKQAKLTSSELQYKLNNQQTVIISFQKDIQQKDRTIALLKEQKSKIEERQREAKEQLYKTRSSLQQVRQQRFYNQNNSSVGLCIHFIAGDIFQEHQQVYRQTLINNIENQIGKIKKTKLLYRFQPLNKVNFHKYIDGVQHIVLIIKTLFGRFIAAYSQSAFLSEGIQQGRGMLMTLSDGSIYHNNPNRLPIKYDDYYIIFGNSEIRLKSLERKLFSNFGIGNSYYDNKKKKKIDFLGVNEGQIDIIGYEIYSLEF